MLKNLFQIKKIIALLLTFVFCYLAIVGKVSAEQFITVFTVIIAFYYGQSTARQAAEENSKQKSIPIVPQEINPVGTITNSDRL